MPRYDRTIRSNANAPYGTCPQCGWEGRDWGFKYRNLCKRCHAKWRKEKNEKCKRFEQPNENLEITAGLVITRNVHERLKGQAWSDIRHTGVLKWANGCEVIGLVLGLIAGGTLVFTSFCLSAQYCVLLYILLVVGGSAAWVANRVVKSEEKRRMPEVQARLEELARERQREIDATQTFYTSPEWRLLREQVIAEQGRRCRQCGRNIKDDFDLTVDHIKPRSKFPGLALDKSNLRILCRRCNSSKGDGVLGEAKTICLVKH